MMNNNPLSKLATRVAGFGFILMLLYNAHTSFYQKLQELSANQQLDWNIVNVEVNQETHYDIFEYRDKTYELKITQYQRNFYTTRCAAMMPFCKGVKAKLNTPTSFDFYTSYNSNENVRHNDQYHLKTIYFNNEKNQAQQIDLLAQAPNSTSAIQAEKKSFIRFFLITLLTYITIMIGLYIFTADEDPIKQQDKRLFFKICSVALMLHYLHFIIQFFINA